MTRTFAVLFFSLLYATHSFANGWFHSEQPYKSGNGVLSNSYQLYREILNLDFREDLVHVEVEYQFNNERDLSYVIKDPTNVYAIDFGKHEIDSTNLENATFIFPIVCDENTEPGYFDLNSYKECGITISGQLNDQTISFTEVRITDKDYAAYNMALLSMRKRDQRITDYETVLYKADIKIPAGPSKLKIKYNQNYHFTREGTSKTPLITRSKNKFIYDFRPASLWDTDDKVELVVNVSGNNEVKFSKEHTAFHYGKNKISNFELSTALLKAELPPSANDFLVGYIRSGYNLDFGASHSLKKYPVSNIHDGDTNTAWCTNTKSPSLSVRIQSSSLYSSPVLGFYITGGYIKNEKVRTNNHRPKSIKIITPNGESLWTVKDTFYNLPINVIGYDTKAATSSIEFEIPNKNEAAVEIKFEFLDYYAGKKYNDFCISELVPIFPG